MSNLVSSLSEEMKHLALIGDTEGLARLIEQVQVYQKYNKIHLFKPYTYQIRFMNASKTYKQRLMRAANQSGKSFGASYEFAQHVTGLYQDYYEGDRIEGSGHLFWCIGVDLDSTARVMQKALLGTSNIKLGDQIGLGSIPLSSIDVDTLIKDGERVVQARIKHVDGGYNTIQFFGAAQGMERLMGAVVKFVWIDEEPKHHSLAIYTQCKMRTATTKGHVMMTATPEQGMTDLQRLFAEDKSGKLYVDSASWWDCPHLSDDDIAELLSSTPEYQRDMRSRGLPVIGSGAVFAFGDDSITCDDITPHPYWDIIVGLDFSSVNDASVVSWVTRDPESGIMYLFHVDYITDLVNKNEEYMAKLILNSQWPWAPTISPHDGGINSINPEAKAKVMKRMGVNVQSRSFYNPRELAISFQNKVSNAREPGLTEMRRLFKEGKLKVCRSVTSFFEEKNQLFYAPVSGGGVKTVGRDDCIDAARYAIISMVGNRGLPVCQCISEPIDFNNGYTDYNSQVSWERE